MTAPAHARDLFARELIAIDDPEFAHDSSVTTEQLCQHPTAVNAIAVLDARWDDLAAIAASEDD